ncbi:MAG: hypothetical protein WB919_13495 [Candidatus Sulfotelmatobacter sp.]
MLFIRAPLWTRGSILAGGIPEFVLSAAGEFFKHMPGEDAICAELCSFIYEL